MFFHSYGNGVWGELWLYSDGQVQTVFSLRNCESSISGKQPQLTVSTVILIPLPRVDGSQSVY